jgi:PIN domain
VSLAEDGLFRARWTDQIHDEWTGHLKAERPEGSDRIDRIRHLLDSSVADCLVMGYESQIDSLKLPDADDRHVLAAAICAHADFIITFNLDDFPASGLSQSGIEAKHPDLIVAQILASDAPRVCGVIGQIRARLRNPQRSPEEYLSDLERGSLPETARLLRTMIGRF